MAGQMTNTSGFKSRCIKNELYELDDVNCCYFCCCELMYRTIFDLQLLVSKLKRIIR